MAYRFTNTEKWTDAWFSELSQLQMLLFIYLCDNCDIAGFIEVSIKRFANDLNSSKETIEGALKGLQRGLIFDKNNETIFVKNFLKHQKNLPLNENNKAHVGILRRFDLYKEKFDIQDINEFIERGFKGASKGLQSPSGISNGNGIGNGIGNGKECEKKTKKHLFKNSPYYDYEFFLKSIDPKYHKFDLKYYHDSAINYSQSKGAMYIDWLAAIRNWVNKDEKEGKAKLLSPMSNNNGKKRTIEERMNAFNEFKKNQK